MGKSYTNAPADDTEAVITIPATDPLGYVKLQQISFSYDEEPSAAKALTVESPASTVLQKWYVTGAGPGPIVFGGDGFKGAKGQVVVVRLAAGGTGIAGSVNAIQGD